MDLVILMIFSYQCLSLLMKFKLRKRFKESHLASCPLHCIFETNLDRSKKKKSFKEYSMMLISKKKRRRRVSNVFKLKFGLFKINFASKINLSIITLYPRVKLRLLIKCNANKESMILNGKQFSNAFFSKKKKSNISFSNYYS